MLYLNAAHIQAIGVDWSNLLNLIRSTLEGLSKQDYAQPIKPYLRYGEPNNRIIAMPAYIGGVNPMAGIKWIASFPGNIHKGKARASSVTILNEHDSGLPLCMINTAKISAIRTAAVTGVMIDEYARYRQGRKFKIGITGAGPIGKMHLQMVNGILDSRIDCISLYDPREVDISDLPEDVREKIRFCNSWMECYKDADIFITCTVADKPYVDLPPKPGSLQLNVSLRDYMADLRRHMDIIVVDDWEEVCRQNTDIENMHNATGLRKEDTVSLADIICNTPAILGNDGDTIMFNPMGMAVFDIAIGGYYYKQAIGKNIGLNMPD